MNAELEAALVEAVHTGDWLYYWQFVAKVNAEKDTQAEK